MKLTVSFSQLPEVRKFSKAHRQLIYAECIEPMLSKYSLPEARNLAAVLVFLLSMVGLQGHLHWVGIHHEILSHFTSFFMAGIAASFFYHVWNVTVISRHRNELQKRIEPVVWEKMTGQDVFAKR